MTKVWISRIAVVGALVWLISASPAYTAQMTSQQAIAIASEFCQKMGWEAGFPTKAVLKPADPRHTPEWHIEYGNKYYVNVEAQRGWIMRGMTWAVGEQREDMTAPAKLTQEQAAALGKKYFDILLSMNQGMGEYYFGKAEVIKPGTEVLPGGSRIEHIEWSVGFGRLFQGIPFDGNGCGMLLHPDTGQLRLFGCNWVTPEPKPVPNPVPKEQAIGTARQALLGAPEGRRNKDAPNLQILACELRIVQRNDNWSAHPIPFDDQSPLAPSNIAWQVILGPPPGYGTDPVAMVWVDAATGEALGGSESGGAYRRPPKASGAEKKAPDPQTWLWLAGAIAAAVILLAGLVLRPRLVRRGRRKG